MARSLAQLQSDMETLSARIEVAKKKEAANIIKEMKLTIETYGLTAADLGFEVFEPAEPIPKRSTKSAASKKTTAKKSTARKLPAKDGKPGKATKKPAAKKAAAPKIKYQDANGNTWSGFGPRPQWIKAAIADGTPLADLAA